MMETNKKEKKMEKPYNESHIVACMNIKPRGISKICVSSLRYKKQLVQKICSSLQGINCFKKVYLSF